MISISGAPGAGHDLAGPRVGRLAAREAPARLAAASAPHARTCRRCGARDVATFAAFARQAASNPRKPRSWSSDPEPRRSLPPAPPPLADAGAQKTRSGVIRALTEGDAALEAALKAGRPRPVARRPPRRAAPRRRAPAGISYAMFNPSTARRLAALARDDRLPLEDVRRLISIMLFAFMRMPTRRFLIHRSPGGETDEARCGRSRTPGREDVGAGQAADRRRPVVGEAAMRSEEDWGRFFEAYRRASCASRGRGRGGGSRPLLRRDGASSGRRAGQAVARNDRGGAPGDGRLP